MLFKNYLLQVLLRIKFREFRKIPLTVYLSKDLVLGSNVKMNSCWIGRNVKLNNHSIVGVNSVLENIDIGEYTQIERGVVVTGCGNGKIKIGKESYIGINVILDFSENITIGDYVHIAASTGLWTHSTTRQCLNGLKLNDKNPEYRPTLPINIENNIYIGPNCTIYPGVTIHQRSIVAPNSAVTKDVEPYTMVGGVPAKFIKQLKKDFINNE